MYDPEDDDLVMEGWLNGHDVHREHDDDLGDGISCMVEISLKVGRGAALVTAVNLIKLA